MFPLLCDEPREGQLLLFMVVEHFKPGCLRDIYNQAR